MPTAAGRTPRRSGKAIAMCGAQPTLRTRIVPRRGSVRRRGSGCRGGVTGRRRAGARGAVGAPSTASGAKIHSIGVLLARVVHEPGTSGRPRSRWSSPGARPAEGRRWRRCRRARTSRRDCALTAAMASSAVYPRLTAATKTPCAARCSPETNTNRVAPGATAPTRSPRSWSRSPRPWAPAPARRPPPRPRRGPRWWPRPPSSIRMSAPPVRPGTRRSADPCPGASGEQGAAFGF